VKRGWKGKGKGRGRTILHTPCRKFLATPLADAAAAGTASCDPAYTIVAALKPHVICARTQLTAAAAGGRKMTRASIANQRRFLSASQLSESSATENRLQLLSEYYCRHTITIAQNRLTGRLRCERKSSNNTMKIVNNSYIETSSLWRKLMTI